MGLENILQFYQNKTVVVTGATGFLAKVFIEKILRVQPNVKKLYVLIRAADAKSAISRWQTEVLQKDLFAVLRTAWGANFVSFISNKVIVVPGDVSHDNLGIEDSNLREEIRREVNIIYNSAAVTTFDERYDVALGVNTVGALHVLSFAKNCPKLEILVHVSTAFVCGEKEGLILESSLYGSELVTRKPTLNIDEETKLVEQHSLELKPCNVTSATFSSRMKVLGTQRAWLHGWPNTYVFTKAMGEMLIGQSRGDIPLVIVRPTMITSTYKEPFSGWIEGIRTIDGVIVAFGKGKLEYFPAKTSSIYDVIPVDMVVNSTMLAMVAHANRSSQTIYHIGSSLRNPLNCATLTNCATEYFTKRPLLNHRGESIKIRKLIGSKTFLRFNTYMVIYYGLPLKGLFLVNTILFQYYKEKYNYLSRKYKTAMRLVNLYRPYLFFKGIFDDTNSKKLLAYYPEVDGEKYSFNFDPQCINWEDYMMNTHIPGLVEFVVK